MYCADMLSISLELAQVNPSYEDIASKVRTAQNGACDCVCRNLFLCAHASRRSWHYSLSTPRVHSFSSTL